MSRELVLSVLRKDVRSVTQDVIGFLESKVKSVIGFKKMAKAVDEHGSVGAWQFTVYLDPRVDIMFVSIERAISMPAH